jgi:hypothetical protein
MMVPLMDEGEPVSRETGAPIGVVARKIYWSEDPSPRDDIQYFDPLDRPPLNAVPFAGKGRWWRIDPSGLNDFFVSGHWARERPKP